MKFPNAFAFAIPRVLFGAGRLFEVPSIAARLGSHALLVTGGSSFVGSRVYSRFRDALGACGLSVATARIPGEPSPAQIDAAVAGNPRIDLVVAVGGGAAIDAGKAIAAMIPLGGEPIRDYLEGVGEKQHPGSTLPVFAVPTTAGTGAEASKNAVISEVGRDGFKKSLRHDNFIPSWVVLDPDLSRSCPPDISAACGLDALTQLIESYTSPKSTPLTDAIAWSGLEAAVSSLRSACGDGALDVAVRGRMSYAAFCSGVTLAHAGLGIVHGLAGPIGGFFPAPHGVVCGTLLAAATHRNIERLRATDENPDALKKYSHIGRLIDPDLAGDDREASDGLVATLWRWTEELAIPTLDRFGLGPVDAEKVVRGSSLKQNPASLTEEEVLDLLRSRIQVV